MINFTAIEQKLWRLALDKAAPEGEFSVAVVKLIKMLRRRGYSAYDNGAAAAAGGLNRAQEEQIRADAYRKGFAAGQQNGASSSRGGFDNTQMQQARDAAYQQGFAEGQRNSDSALARDAYTTGYQAGYCESEVKRARDEMDWATTTKQVCRAAIARWWAAKKKPIILTIAALWFVAASAGGVWLFMPHGPEVRRAELVKLPPPHHAPARHSKHHHAGDVASKLKRKIENS